MTSLFSGFFSELDRGGPPTDIISTESEWKAFIEIPGVKNEDIQIDVSHKFLVISYEKKRFYRPTQAEITYGKVSRTFTLPFSVESKDDVHVQYENGILTIVVVHDVV